MIYKPYALCPSTLIGDSHSVIDVTKAQNFSYLTRGDSPIVRHAVQFYNDSTLVLATPSSGYYQDKKGNPINMLIPVTAAVFAAHSLSNGHDYSWRVLLWTSTQATYTVANANIISDWVSFTAIADPALSMNVLSSAYYNSGTQRITSKKCEWTATYISSSPIRYQHWTIFDGNEAVVYDTGDVYGCYPLKCYFEGLVSDQSYYAKITVCNQLGQISAVTGDEVYVEYASANNYGAITTSLLENGGVKIDLSGYSGLRGVSEVDDAYEIHPNVPTPNKSSIIVGDGNTVSWDDETALDAASYRIGMQCALSTDNLGHPICTFATNSDATHGVQLFVDVVEGLKPSASLSPSAALTPSDPKYYVEAKDVTGAITMYGFTAASRLEGLSETKNWYYVECILSWSGSDVTVSSMSVSVL